MIGIVVPSQASDLALFLQATAPFLHDPRFQVYLLTDGEAPLERVTTVQRGIGIHIARWWNLGLAAAERDGCEYVAWVESDVRISPVTIMEMVRSLNAGVGMVAPILNPVPGQLPRVFRDQGVAPIPERLEQCYAFRRGWPYAHADERFQWWCHGTDMAWRNYDHGGTELVRGDGKTYHPPLGTTNLDLSEEMRQMVVEDMEYFAEKWKSNPW